MIILRNNTYFKKWAIVNSIEKAGMEFLLSSAFCCSKSDIENILFLQIDKVDNILGNDWQEITVNPTHILTSIFASSCAEDYVCTKKIKLHMKDNPSFSFFGKQIGASRRKIF